jgi:hypothetical protein
VPRTKDLKDLEYEEANKPYIIPGTLFRPRKHKWYSDTSPGEVFFDFHSNRNIASGEVLMYLKYLGFDTGINNTRNTKFGLHPLPLNSFWNVTCGHLSILEGYHWWFEDELEQLMNDEWL